MKRFYRFTRLQRLTLILFVIVVTNWLMIGTTGYAILGGDLFTLFFIVFLILLGLTLVPPLVRKVVWRVRNRLLVTYFLIGVLPIVLMATIVTLGFYMLLGATVAYISQAELDQRLGQLENNAQQLALHIADGARASREAIGGQGLIRVNDRTAAAGGRVTSIPVWSSPGFRGVVRMDATAYFLAAHSEARKGQRRVEVFRYLPLDDQMLGKLARGLAPVRLFRLRDLASNPESAGDGEFEPDRAAALDSSRVEAPPPALGFWDIPGFSGWPLVVRALDTGDPDDHLVNLSPRPSSVINHLLTPFGTFASAILISLLVTASAFLVVEMAALISSVQLTRSVTRTVHDLYTGTKTIEAGDFSHRIPIRTKDQLSELARSFNSMTEHLERLILEVKEKEKLESELEIARQVQSQLFPKGVPELRTLELAGHCSPGRIVSGDYYDFIRVDARSTALVIGDISGKGISAALLMASMQSALHAQLTLDGIAVPSTATLVARLNRHLYDNTSPEKYATFYCGVYDDENGRLRYTNAGHLPPILIRLGKASRLEANGTVVGLFPDFPYEQNLIDLKRGDLIAAFTDGVTECEDRSGDQFGEARLIELLTRNVDRPLDEIIQIVTQSVREWAYDLDNQDDTTLLLARRI